MSKISIMMDSFIQKRTTMRLNNVKVHNLSILTILGNSIRILFLPKVSTILVQMEEGFIYKEQEKAQYTKMMVRYFVTMSVDAMKKPK